MLFCDRCAAKPAIIRLGRGGGPKRLLCEGCSRLEAASLGINRFDLIRFFMQLALPQAPKPLLDIQTMPHDRACPGCGLTFGEFADKGLAGCAQCYTIFAPAVEHALAVLNQMPV